MHMSLNKLWELVLDREAWHAAVQESDMTKQLNWTVVVEEKGYKLPGGTSKGIGENHKTQIINSGECLGEEVYNN